MGTTGDPLSGIATAMDKLTTDLKAQFAALTTEIQGLKAGTPVTQAQIDALMAKVTAADDTVTTFSA